MRGLFFSHRITEFSVSFLLAILIAGCSAGTTSSGTTTPTPAGSAPVATVQISGAPTTIKSDNSNTTTITVTAVDANNAAVSGATITLNADTGLLSTQTLVTDSTGKATATFSSGTANKDNRTATITATSGSVTALLPVQIVGSTLTLTASGTSLPSNGTSPVTLTITAKDAGGNLISNAPVTVTQSGTGTVTLTPASGTTNSSGQFAVIAAGATAGTVTASASAVGATATISLNVSVTSTNFGITLVTLNGGTGVVPTNPKISTMQIGDTLAVQVTAPAPTTSVLFATTIGIWNGVATTVTVPVAGGKATATLSTTVTGNATVQVSDATTGTPTDTLTVGITAKVPDHIKLQVSPAVIPQSIGSTSGFSNLTATVFDALNQPVGGVPVAFSIVAGSGTGSGESVSPVVVYTATTTANGLALGTAPTTFTSGSLSSSSAGVQIRASVVGTSIATGSLTTTPAPSPVTSSPDAAIVIGGTAGSVAFGQAAKIIDPGTTGTTYTFPMSVLVADSNGSPAPLGTVVNISVWPIAWTTGSRGYGCDPDPDGYVWDPTAADPVTGLFTGAYVVGNGGTFYNEDANQNLILDAGEDGTRKLFADGTVYPAGTIDGKPTPLNSYGGTVVSTNPADLPGTATTDATGLATFNLTYTKSSAIWIVSRIHAQTLVQGSPAVGQLDFRLAASEADAGTTCYLPKSPFVY